MATPTEAGPPAGDPAIDDASAAPDLTGPDDAIVDSSVDPHRRAFRVGLAAITAVGFLWRLAFTLATKRHDSSLFDEGDAFFYSNIARNLALGRWYVNPFNGTPAADHPPLTVLVLGPTAKVFRDSVLAQRLTMTVIGTLVIVAIGLLGRRLGGWKMGLGAAAVAAANPNLWINDAVIMSESISALLIVASLATGYELVRRPTLGRAALAGATLGLTVLARAEVGLLLPFMVVPILLRASTLSWVERAARLGLCVVAMVSVIAPWTLWNMSHYNEPVWLSTNDGTTLLGANCPPVYDSGIVGGWSLRCVLDTKVDGLDASEASARQRHVGLAYAKAHAGRLPVVVVAREGRTFGFWRPDQSVFANQGEGRPKWASWAAFGGFWALIPVAAFGALTFRRRGISLIPIAACLATVVVVSALFYGIPRFRLPLDVAMCLLAGAAISAIGSTGARSAGSRPSETAG